VVSSNLKIYNDSIWFLEKLRTILKLPTMMGIPKKKRKAKKKEETKYGTKNQQLGF